jgi:hypothetical protein
MNNPFQGTEAAMPSQERKRNIPPPAVEQTKESARHKQMLLQALEAYEDDPKAALQLLAAQKKESAEDGAEQIRIALLKKAYRSLDNLEARLQASVAESSERVRSDLGALMHEMEGLSHALPANRPEWNDLTKRYKRLLDIKKGSSTEVSRVFSEIFDQFNDFIEDKFVAEAVRQVAKKEGSANIAKVTEMVYGRTKEEVEGIKRANRERTIDLVDELKEKPYVSFDDIRQLHQTNNRGIIPKSYSRLREGATEEHLEEQIGFGKRFGTLVEDLPEEIVAFEKRVEHLIDQALVQNMSDAQYEIAVAKLHNELLDIHPFNDRNGSTALLFIELMMARKGYEPSKKREPSYYKALGRALDYNPVAMSVVGYQQYKISNEYGYFEGEIVKTKKKRYELAKTVIQKMHQKKSQKPAAV